MSYAYGCTETGHTSGNIWTFSVVIDDTGVGISDCYYVKAINTSSVPNSEAIWCFYDGITPGVTDVSAEITRYAYDVRQEFTQSVTVESYAQSDVSYVRPLYVSTSIDSEPPVNEVVTGTTAELNDVLLHQSLAQNARAYFDTPTAPSIDVDIYTTGANGNKIVSFKYGNIQNIPPGMYSSSYLVRFGVNHTAAPDATIPITLLGIQQYNRPQEDRFYQIGYVDALNRMGQTAQGYAIDNGRLIFFVQLFHHDDGDVIDATYIFGVDEDGTITDGTPPDTGGTVNIYTNTSPHDNDEYDDDDGSMDSETAGQALSIDNLLTTSYALTDSELIDFGRWLWNNDLTAGLYAYQVSPIENILACKRIPFDVASATTTYIWLGNLRSTVQAKTASTNHIQTVTATPVQIPCYYDGDYMNMQNIISIYLPFVGIQSLPTSICYKSTTETVTLPNGVTHKVSKMVPQYIKVEYVFDMIYGTCAALVYIGEYSGGVFSGVLQGAYNGTCGVDIPLTQSNRASNELALKKEGANTVAGVLTSAISGAVSGSAGGIAGSIIGGLTSGLMAGISGGLRESNTKAGQETHFTTMGGFSSQVASFMPSSVMLFVEHFVYTEPKEYAHENGYPCNLCLNMSDIVGYTELDGSIEITDIPCFEEERQLLKQALQDGFYL